MDSFAFFKLAFDVRPSLTRLIDTRVDTLTTIFSAASARSSRDIAVNSRSTMVLRTMKPMLAPRSLSETLQMFGSGVGTSESGPTRRPQIGSSAPLETVTTAPRRDAPPLVSGSTLTPRTCCVSWHAPTSFALRMISGMIGLAVSSQLEVKLTTHSASTSNAAVMSTVPRNATPLPACAAMMSPPPTNDTSAEGTTVAEGTTGTTSNVVGSMVPQTSAALDVLSWMVMTRPARKLRLRVVLLIFVW
eukprot:scaffold42267_cov66-Phaeocystis_antarctica.AAC.7